MDNVLEFFSLFTAYTKQNEAKLVNHLTQYFDICVLV